jgi:uncharacterized membrane protein SirB2
MIAYYLEIKQVHYLCVLLSGALFAVRGALVLGGRSWAMAAPLRWTSYAIDTTLLTAAFMLATVLRLDPLSNPWLGLKIGLLVVYVVLGSYALKRGRSIRVRAACYSSAVLLYVAMIGIARAHHPLGWLRWFGWV